MGRQGDVSCTPGKRGRDGARLGLGLGLGPACLPSRGGTRFESRQASLGPSPQKLAVMGGAAASGLALALFAGLFLARSEQHERLRFKPAQPGEPRPVRLFTEPELARYDGQEVGRRPGGRVASARTGAGCPLAPAGSIRGFARKGKGEPEPEPQPQLGPIMVGP